MANKQRGETDVTVGGRTYTLVLDMNAICELEELLSTDKRPGVFIEIIRAAEKGQVRALRGLMWAALQRHHPDMTLERTDALISEAGGLMNLMLSLQDAVKASQPEADEAGARKGRPQKAQANASAGVNSTSSRGASV